MSRNAVLGFALSINQGQALLLQIGLALAVVAAALWAGGPAGLLLVRRHRRFGDTAARYSRLHWAVSWRPLSVEWSVRRCGGAAVRLGDWVALGTSRYGVLVLVLVGALLLAGLAGAAHRSRSTRRRPAPVAASGPTSRCGPPRQRPRSR